MLNHPESHLCPYTSYSLRFYLLAPILLAGSYLSLPFFMSIALSILIPRVVLDAIINLGNKHISLVNHYPHTDHPHSTSTTIGVILRSTLLSLASSVGLRLILSGQPHTVILGTYTAILSVFHFTEFFVTSLTNPRTLQPDSFLLCDSIAYMLAISCSFLEYIIECYLFPGFKNWNVISTFGLLLCIFGDTLRKSAMFTAGSNFSHLISSEKRPEHKLITHGVYSMFRHPAYAGWFYWAVGTQILVQNPLCFLLFTFVSCKFFSRRIIYEEYFLVDFFGQEYESYREKVRLWMPINKHLG